MSAWLIALILFIVATLLFILEVLGVGDGDPSLIACGLACLAGGEAVWLAGHDRRVP